MTCGVLVEVQYGGNKRLLSCLKPLSTDSDMLGVRLIILHESMVSIVA